MFVMNLSRIQILPHLWRICQQFLFIWGHLCIYF